MKYKYNFISAATSFASECQETSKPVPSPLRFYFAPFKSRRLLQDSFFDVAAELE